jgi:nicotinic acid mononucleotide adenylyltransferase
MNCWIRKTHNGKIYSINVKKGESQWGEPLNDTDQVGWEKNTSNTFYGMIYYRNIKTKNTQWEKPKKENKKLEKNWEERRSRQCNQIYYINKKENISRWTHPNESVTQTKPKYQDALWPMKKTHNILHDLHYEFDQHKKQKFAVVLTTGSMNPVHRGHISLMEQSIARLYKAGYKVIGAWISPSHDIYVQSKALKLKTIDLSAQFRVEVTKLTVAHDYLIDVGLWESSQDKFVDFPDVCLSLKKHIEEEVDFKDDEITVFYACGADHAKNFGLYKGPQKWGGVVVVPREGDKIGEENAHSKVYVAEPSKGDIASYSSTKIRKAIAENKEDKEDIVKKMMSDDAARFLLHPTQEEYTKFSADFVKLKSKKPVLLTKKEKLIDNNFEIPWIKTNAKFILYNKRRTQSRDGNYVFNPSTLELITNVGGTILQTTTVMYTKCMVSAREFRETSESIKPKITPIIGKIQTEIQKSGRRHKIFVLPSQLNAAEYPNDKTIINEVDYYKYDETGGPLGQLSADPAVAQFIIDNACNDKRPDEGINNVRLMGEINGIRFHNGYLKVKNNVDVEAFKEAIPNMTILGIKDVPVRGLDSVMKNFVNMLHKVDLIYASAVPYGNLKTGELTYGNSKHENVRTIAKLTLFAQYVGSMRLAISRGNCELILMPLGGGFFKNALEDIKSAIISAYDYMEEELKKSNVTVYLLLYEDDADEIAFFNK